MELIEPSIEYGPEFWQAAHEHVSSDKQNEDPNFLEEIGNPKSFEDYIKIRKDHSQGKNLPTDWVGGHTYWLIAKNSFIGEVNIRPELTKHLRNVGGQIGYWIAANKRKQGYGTQILKMALDKARQIDMKKILVTCDEDNEPSKKIIETCGGVFERSQPLGENKPSKLLYWINL